MTTADGLKPLTFPPELYKRLVPAQYLSHHLSARPPIRPDSRSPADFRQLSVTTGSLSNTNGSSVVRLGQTIMSCGIRAEVTEPNPFEPEKGFIVPNIEIGPLCHSMFKSGPPSDLQQSIAYALMQLLESAALVRLEDLCIEKGKAVWVLYIDIICLSHAGSLLSCATSSLVAALANTSLPLAEWDADEHIVLCKREYTPLKLGKLIHMMEFGVFEDTVLADMTDEEENLCMESITIAMDSSGAIISLRKSGGTVLGQDRLQSVLSLAAERLHVLDSTLKNGQKNKL